MARNRGPGKRPRRRRKVSLRKMREREDPHSGIRHVLNPIVSSTIDNNSPGSFMTGSKDNNKFKRKMKLVGYELPLCRQDYIEIERELIDLDYRDDANAAARRSMLILVLEQSVISYRKSVLLLQIK